jgi:NAD-dependent dihydropyrimidine dehydrogenase PreA subunit
MMGMPIIDASKCEGCGLCVSVCKCGVLVLIENKATISQREECHGCIKWCTLCESVCPNEAISCPLEIIIEEKQGPA